MTDAELLDAVIARFPDCRGEFVDDAWQPCPRKAVTCVGGLAFCDEHAGHEKAGTPRALTWAPEIRAWEKMRAESK